MNPIFVFDDDSIRSTLVASRGEDSRSPADLDRNFCIRNASRHPIRVDLLCQLIFVGRSLSLLFLRWLVARTSVVRQLALEVPQEVMVEVILPVAYQRQKKARARS